MKKNIKKSLNRTQYREMEKKIVPAIKALSNYVHNTTDTPSVFHGYRLPAGEFVDKMGRIWQVQLHAVVSKSKQIKKEEVQPIIAKGAIMFRIRVYIKALMDSIFN